MSNVYDILDNNFIDKLRSSASNAEFRKLFQTRLLDEIPVQAAGVTRFEVIDHSAKARGRFVVECGVRVEVSIQDDGRTMKVFLTTNRPPM